MKRVFKMYEITHTESFCLYVYEGCSIYNETVLITFTFYKVQRHKYFKH